MSLSCTSAGPRLANICCRMSQASYYCTAQPLALVDKAYRSCLCCSCRPKAPTTTGTSTGLGAPGRRSRGLQALHFHAGGMTWQTLPGLVAV